MKQRITIDLDPDVATALNLGVAGWETRLEEAIRRGVTMGYRDRMIAEKSDCIGETAVQEAEARDRRAEDPAPQRFVGKDRKLKP